MIRYVFNEEKVLAIKNLEKADPQKLGEAIVKIAKRNNGKAEPDQLWRDAKGNPKHPAYHLYEWDVEKAAEAHWTETSRRIIRSIVPLDDDGEQMNVPAFVSIKADDGVGYRHYAEVMESASLQAAVLAQAERDLLAFQQRYRRFKQLFDLVEPVIHKTRELRGKSREEDRPSR
jgi:hypothetical protein